MKRSLFALALAAALPMSASAATISHLYAEFGYVSADVLGDDNMDGWQLKGEADIARGFYALGSYSRVGDDNIDSGFVDTLGNPILIDINFDETAIGVGYHHAISDKADWNTEVSYVHDQVDLNGHAFGAGDDGDNGYRVATGLRGMLAPKFEGSIYINYTDVNDFGNGVGAGIGGVFHFNDTWGLTAGYDHADRDNGDIDSWNLGVRASF